MTIAKSVVIIPAVVVPTEFPPDADSDTSVAALNKAALKAAQEDDVQETTAIGSQHDPEGVYPLCCRYHSLNARKESQKSLQEYFKQVSDNAA
ncbi:hypothetical protein HK100_000291 [Physocladia obscura]|uniref:Uncharacterized protein n=1 Tax=Physocladia obscura TaxID=109957 RepID=A0AAD5XCM2_9FUNG|nr:hypothetical protein HK100_000291 [Physocladia obscura]